jgi:hypothetical protein
MFVIERLSSSTLSANMLICMVLVSCGPEDGQSSLNPGRE